MCFLSGGELLVIYIVVAAGLQVKVLRSRSDGRIPTGEEAWNLSAYTRRGRRWFAGLMAWVCMGPVFLVLWIAGLGRCNG